MFYFCMVRPFARYRRPWGPRPTATPPGLVPPGTDSRAGGRCRPAPGGAAMGRRVSDLGEVCPGCWWGLLRYGGALGYGPHHAARAAGAGTVSRSGGRLGVVRPTPRPPVRAAPIGAALLQHLPPLPACPGAGRPAALAADDRSPEITPGFPPGLFYAWAAQTSPFAVLCPGTVATPGPYVLPQGGRPPTLGGRSCDLVHAFRQ